MASEGRSGGKAPFYPGLQIAEDMRFQRRSWVAERVGWAAMAVLTVAALLGLFSTGPLSWAEARDEAGMVRVEYERFLRHLAPTTVRVHIAPGAGVANDVSIRIGWSLAKSMQIESVQPEPQQTLMGESGLTFVFRLAESGGPGIVSFSIKPEEPARIVRGEVGLADRSPARFTQVTYP